MFHSSCDFPLCRCTIPWSTARSWSHSLADSPIHRTPCHADLLRFYQRDKVHDEKNKTNTNIDSLRRVKLCHILGLVFKVGSQIRSDLVLVHVQYFKQNSLTESIIMTCIKLNSRSDFNLDPLNNYLEIIINMKIIKLKKKFNSVTIIL